MKDSTHNAKCFVCNKGCPCGCLEIDCDNGIINFCSMDCYNKSNKELDWDAEFGSYDGHYAECELGNHFQEKHKELVKQLSIWRNLANEYNHKLHLLKEEGDEINGK
jgi:hypothetical protein